MPRYAITNFSRGEFGPALYGRVDIPQYNAGAKELTNFIIQRYGGASFRPGFRFVGEANPTKTHRYLPFEFSVEQAYVSVLEDSKQWLLANGGYVAEDDLQIVSVTAGNPTILEVPFHDMAVGDPIYVDGVTGMLELNGRFSSVVSVPDADHIGVDIDSTAFAAFIDSTGIVRTEAPTPPPDPEPAPPPPPDPAPPPTTAGGGGGGGGSSTGPGTYDSRIGSALA